MSIKYKISLCCLLLISFLLVSCNKNCEFSEESFDSEKENVVTIYCVESETFLETETENITVYIAPTGKRYHNKRTCAGKNALPIDLNLAKNYHTACKKCVG